ncbi:MAG: flagellar basal body P-ring protein FlgI [Zoogloeaceae bacterium]|jgi:flagellar P-ring protein precursor FlgI|nr:flagellar basal body P-ring protein FlgI [Zoogloeaceae bacterium]
MKTNYQIVTRSPMPTRVRTAILAACLSSLAASLPVYAERVKDLASVQGVRNNQLAGYGLVVGLDNSGDQTTQTPFTSQSMLNMLAQMGVNLPLDQVRSIQLKNVAAVMVTATHPPFARPGQTIDVTVSSIGNAKSLRGGTLLMTPLKGADGETYAVAQGTVLVPGAGASAPGARPQVNHLSAGRIPEGATVEREVPTTLGAGPYVVYELHAADFDMASRMVRAINQTMGNGVAQALDSRQIRVTAPETPNARVAFMGRLENIEVAPVKASPRVVMNPRTGSVVMNQLVTIEACAISHGNLSVIISGNEVADAPPVAARLSTDGINLLNLKAGVNLADVVKALNSLGANPQDLLAILQAMKAAGALKAELEII